MNKSLNRAYLPIFSPEMKIFEHPASLRFSCAGQNPRSLMIITERTKRVNNFCVKNLALFLNFSRIFTKKQKKEELDAMFSCYDETITVPIKNSLNTK